MLKCFNPHLKIGLLSTDNFIYPNKVLKKKGIFDQKGFTPSYNWELLFKTLEKIKGNRKVIIPYYSQNLSDIHSKKKIKSPNNYSL